MPADEWEGTIGYALHPDVQGRGLAAEAAAELLVIGFRELRLRRITADAYADNIASNRVLRRIGMRHEATTRAKSLGKDGTWLDDNTWALLREEWPAEQRAPSYPRSVDDERCGPRAGRESGAWPTACRDRRGGRRSRHERVVDEPESRTASGPGQELV